VTYGDERFVVETGESPSVTSDIGRFVVEEDDSGTSLVTISGAASGRLTGTPVVTGSIALDAKPVPFATTPVALATIVVVETMPVAFPTTPVAFAGASMAFVAALVAFATPPATPASGTAKAAALLPVLLLLFAGSLLKRRGAAETGAN